jgi:hypothetical protein
MMPFHSIQEYHTAKKMVEIMWDKFRSPLGLSAREVVELNELTARILKHEADNIKKEKTE